VKSAVKNYFLEKELACHCCGVNGVQADFLEKLNLLRVKYGRPIIPTSVYRCVKHNQEVGGEPQSFHLQGRAADIPVKGGADCHWLVACATMLRLSVIVYPTFVHVDNRPGDPLLLLGSKR
jgi:zinc D-Ala-D-Ala carboxypeptidase